MLCLFLQRLKYRFYCFFSGIIALLRNGLKGKVKHKIKKG